VPGNPLAEAKGNESLVVQGVVINNEGYNAVSLPSASVGNVKIPNMSHELFLECKKKNLRGIKIFVFLLDN
jgi:hypothetical protein